MCFRILEKMRSCLWILDPGFWTYGWVHLVGPTGPNVVFRPQAQRSRNFFRDFMGLLVCCMILEKIRSCLWIMKPEFWAYGWVCLVGPNGPNVVSRSQAPRSRNFLRFHNFIGFASWFLRKWDPVWENWSQGSGLIA